MRVTKEGRRPSAETYPAQGSEKSAPNTIFIGEVLAQTVINEGSKDLRLLEVTFKDGARNKLHTHTTDQILVFTEGDGIVATTEERRDVRAGDVAFIPAGEPHWHGAQPGRDATHWSITGQAVTKIVGD